MPTAAAVGQVSRLPAATCDETAGEGDPRCGPSAMFWNRECRPCSATPYVVIGDVIQTKKGIKSF